jgi:hypothetical protein
MRLENESSVFSGIPPTKKPRHCRGFESLE